jgi:putative PIN family toxin of toxin-antitoxin system
MLEYEEIIQQKYSLATANALLTLLSELVNVNNTNQYFRWRLIENDLDDNKYCDCAIAGQADYIVTEDKHFEILKRIPFPSITTLDIDQFLKILQTS